MSNKKGKRKPPLHSVDGDFFSCIREVAFACALEFNLPLKVVEPKGIPSPGWSYGLCHHEERWISIVIRFRNTVVDGGQWHRKRLELSFTLSTVAHELAHLKFNNHSKQFRAYVKVLEPFVRSYWRKHFKHKVFPEIGELVEALSSL